VLRMGTDGACPGAASGATLMEWERQRALLARRNASRTFRIDGAPPAVLAGSEHELEVKPEGDPGETGIHLDSVIRGVRSDVDDGEPCKIEEGAEGQRRPLPAGSVIIARSAKFEDWNMQKTLLGRRAGSACLPLRPRSVTVSAW
jgi:hypothetical protein